MHRPLIALAFFALLPFAAPPAGAAEPPERVVGIAERGGLDLILYQDDTALVRDRRMVALDKGAALLTWEGVAREAHPTTGLLSGVGLAVKSQGFDVEGAGGDRLLAASVGTEVDLVWRGGDAEKRAKVLAAGASPLFEIDGKVVAGQPDRIVYDALPAGLRAGPAFRAQVVAETAGRRELELTYLTGGVGWQADYVAELAPAGDRMTLSAWATLVNGSGVDLPGARVTVVAGRPNRGGGGDGRARAMMVAAPSPPPEHESFGPYHLFALPEPVSLRQGQRLQAVLLPPTAVKVERELVLEPLPAYAWRGPAAEIPRQNPVATLKFDNVAAVGLGRALPAGALRLYQRGADNGLVLLGEDRLPGIPEKGAARIAIGQAFDVTARRLQVDFQHVSAEVAEAAWEVRLANAGDRPATLTVKEAFGGDWLVVEESQPHHRLDAATVAWTVTIPAKGEVALKYRVRVKG